MLHVDAEYNLPFPPNGRLLQAKKGIKSTADPCDNTINCTPSSSFCVTKMVKLFHNFKKLVI